MNRIALTGVWALFAAARVIEACSAQVAIDRAQQNRETDAFRSARDVAVKAMDSTSIEQTATHVDAATGTLLLEGCDERYWKWGAPNVAELGRAASTTEDFRWMLEKPAYGGHGVLADPEGGAGYHMVNGRKTETVRDHVLFHAAGGDLYQNVAFSTTGASGGAPAASPAEPPAVPARRSPAGEGGSPVEPPAVSPVEPPAPPVAAPAVDHAG